MISKEKARLLRTMIVKASAYLTDEDAIEVVEMFKEWKPQVKYEVDDRIRYNDNLYRVQQTHTSQSDWTPDIVPALYELIK